MGLKKPAQCLIAPCVRVSTRDWNGGFDFTDNLPIKNLVLVSFRGHIQKINENPHSTKINLL